MDNIWYYAEGDKSVGPISLSDLTAVLSRISNAKNVLVWRDGFSGWEKTEKVPELAPYVIKPPPLPISPPPLPQKTIAPSSSPAVISDTRTNYESSGTIKEDLVGIGGWLIPIAIGQALGPPIFLVSLLSYYTKLDSNLWTKYPIGLSSEAVLYVSLLAIMSYTTYLFFTKARLFPTFFIYECVALILFFPLKAILAAATLSANTGQSIDTIMARLITSDHVARWIAVIIVDICWIWYIKKSKRVANTFLESMIGRNASTVHRQQQQNEESSPQSANTSDEQQKYRFKQSDI